MVYFSSTATSHNVVFTATAGISIILSAVYMLNMIQSFWKSKCIDDKRKGYLWNEKAVLVLIVVLILALDFTPNPFSN